MTFFVPSLQLYRASALFETIRHEAQLSTDYRLSLFDLQTSSYQALQRVLVSLGENGRGSHFLRARPRVWVVPGLLGQKLIRCYNRPWSHNCNPVIELVFVNSANIYRARTTCCVPALGMKVKKAWLPTPEAFSLVKEVSESSTMWLMLRVKETQVLWKQSVLAGRPRSQRKCPGARDAWASCPPQVPSHHWHLGRVPEKMPGLFPLSFATYVFCLLSSKCFYSLGLLSGLWLVSDNSPSPVCGIMLGQHALPSPGPPLSVTLFQLPWPLPLVRPVQFCRPFPPTQSSGGRGPHQN